MKNAKHAWLNAVLKNKNIQRALNIRNSSRSKPIHMGKIMNTAKTRIWTASTLLSAMMVSIPALAEDIVYDGSNNILRDMPSGYGRNTTDVLYPGTSSPSESNNTVTVDYTMGTAPEAVYGGLVNATSGAYGGNTVHIANGSVNEAVYGIYSSNINADDDLTLENNVVYIRQGTTVSKQVYGAYARKGVAQYNTVYIEGGEIYYPVMGAYISGSYGGQGNTGGGHVLNNTVEVSGGTIYSNVFGGVVEAGQIGEANYNTVRISGGEIQGNWVHSDAPGIVGGYSYTNGNANGNTVEISGSPVIYTSAFDGGSGEIFWIAGGVSFDADATHNTVTISGTPNFKTPSGSQNMLVISGGTLGDATYDGFTGNTLNYAAHPITVYAVQNFEQYNFTLDPNLANTTTALITAQDIKLGNGAGTPSTIEVVGIHSGPVLQTGDEFILMQADNMRGEGVGTTSTGVAQQGISLLYDVRTDVDVAGKQVTATIVSGHEVDNGNGNSNGNGNGGNNGVSGGNNGASGGSNGSAARVNPQLKALSEGYLSGLMLVNRGADMVAFDAYHAIKTQNPDQGLSPFVLLSVGQTRYSSGSNIKSNDFLFMGGLSLQHNGLTLGAFLEGGRGDYDTYNSFYNAAHVRGAGNNRYIGLGVLGRYQFSNHLYTEGSIRFGKTRTKFNTTDLINFASGEFARYSIKSNYTSAHAGLGYILALNAQNSIDFSAKYLWSRVGSKSVQVAGDPIAFKRINSSRVRLDAQLKHQYSDNLTLSAGLGYEHEFNGKANATTYQTYNIEAPSVKGSTGILSLGVTITPTFNKNLSLNLKADGYIGKRKGVRGGLMVKYAF